MQIDDKNLAPDKDLHISEEKFKTIALCNYLIKPDNNVVFLDTETSGFAGFDKVCELTVLNSKNEVLFDQMFNLGTTKMNPEASAISGITDEMLQDKPSFSQFSQQIKDLLKDKLSNNTEESSKTAKYLYYFLEALETTPDLKYVLGYIAKTTGFVSADEYIYDADSQFAFESIFYSAMIMYRNGSASRDRLIEVDKKFENDIVAKQEEKLSRTQELYTTQAQALKELGYTELTKENAAEVLEKMAEIESRAI